MAYRNDKDLEFLGKIRDSDLNDLVAAVTKDKDGKTWVSEELTGKEIYKKNYPRHSMYWKEVAAEIQCFGANSLVTLFRLGEGVLYREVLEDVCDKCKVNYNKNQSVHSVEEQLLIKLLGDATEKMSLADREKFARMAGFSAAASLTPEGMLMAAQAAFMAGGVQSYRLTFMIASYVSNLLLGRGISLVAGAALSRTLGVIAGPIGWTITGAWTAFDLASPAFRVTLPAVIQVAILRKSYQAERDGILKDIEAAMKGL